MLQPDVRLLGLLRLHVHDARGHVRLRLQRVLRADDAAELGAAGPEPDRHLPEHVLRPELRVLDVLLVLGPRVRLRVRLRGLRLVRADAAADRPVAAAGPRADGRGADGQADEPDAAAGAEPDGRLPRHVLRVHVRGLARLLGGLHVLRARELRLRLPRLHALRADARAGRRPHADARADAAADEPDGGAVTEPDRRLRGHARALARRRVLRPVRRVQHRAVRLRPRRLLRVHVRGRRLHVRLRGLQLRGPGRARAAGGVVRQRVHEHVLRVESDAAAEPHAAPDAARRRAVPRADDELPRRALRRVELLPELRHVPRRAELVRQLRRPHVLGLGAVLLVRRRHRAVGAADERRAELHGRAEPLGRADAGASARADDRPVPRPRPRRARPVRRRVRRLRRPPVVVRRRLRRRRLQPRRDVLRVRRRRAVRAGRVREHGRRRARSVR